jgi:putative spermidine/putrescine transport system permease protein
LGPRLRGGDAALRDRRRALLLAVPALAVFAAFWLLPMAKLVQVGASGKDGFAAYAAVVTNPNYFRSLVSTVTLSLGVTVVTLILSLVAGIFLQRNRFPGRGMLVSLMTLPLAFPGVVVGFMVILLAGRQGLIGEISSRLFDDKLVFAYGMAGLFTGYLYFSIPRVILTIMASVEKLDPALEEAARSLGASTWQVTRDVILPALGPAIISSGAICFATSMGAFGTAFTLATQINVLPLTIYNEFTNYANFSMAAALSIVLGLITWAALALARSLAGAGVAAAG